MAKGIQNSNSRLKLITQTQLFIDPYYELMHLQQLNTHGKKVLKQI